MLYLGISKRSDNFWNEKLKNQFKIVFLDNNKNPIKD